MRKSLIAALSGICLLASPAFAGEVTITNGQATWRSTQCMAPVTPAVLNGTSSEAAASDVNTRVTQYNDYTRLVQVYLDCMSNEAQTDATGASSAVIASATAQMNEVQQRANALGAPLKK
jgi:hypothetical protein